MRYFTIVKSFIDTMTSFEFCLRFLDDVGKEQCGSTTFAGGCKKYLGAFMFSITSA